MNTAESMDTTSRKRLAVLVVEDERLVARDIERTLDDIGYAVTASVATGEAAFRAARERRPDVVLMDIHIKGAMDGIETADLLVKRLRLPVVYLTAYADEDTLARAATTSPYGYVVKPFSAGDVRSAIEVASQKHRIDMRLAERERWFSTTLRSIGDAVVACDAEERVLFMNPVAELLTGYSAGEAEGRSITDIVSFGRENLSPPEHPVRRALKERTVQALPPGCRLLDRNGSPSRAIEDSAAPIIHNGTLLGAVVVFRDVTRQRQLEEQMAVTDRLSSLGVLAASVGHEINNPLTYNLANVAFVIQELEELRSELGPATLDNLIRSLEEARDGAERIAKIVSDLKVFSTAEQQALRRIDVGACVDWALRVAGNRLEHAAKVVRDLQRMPPVMANEVRLSQVFVNLLVNAAQAIAGRPEDNQIRIVGRTDPQGNVVVDVEDSGPGIPSEVAARIFEPFFTTRGSGVGAGLGLSICRDIVQWLGGTLTMSSRPEGGTSFRVMLPPADQHAGTEFGDPVTLVKPKRLRLLVVDDDAALGRTIHRILASNDVTVVQSAHHALALVREEPSFDLILCDMMMPDMSGIDFYEELWRTKPVIARTVAFMTGGAFSARTSDFLRDVNPPCLSKPFTAETLCRFVCEVSGGHGSLPPELAR